METCVLQIPLLDDTIGKFFLSKVYVDIFLPQSLTQVKRSTISLSPCTTYVIDVCDIRKPDVIPSSDVCSVCLTVGHLPPRREEMLWG